MEREKLNLEEAMGATVKDAADETVERAQQLTEKAGETLEFVGEAVRQHLPGSGTAAEAAEAVSGGLKHTADYLREEGVSGIVEDLEVLIRRYPLQTLVLGLSCGYLLSRFRPE